MHVNDKHPQANTGRCGGEEGRARGGTNKEEELRQSESWRDRDVRE